MKFNKLCILHCAAVFSMMAFVNAKKNKDDEEITQAEDVHVVPEPFSKDVTMNIIGMVLMVILVTLSVAGGLSGAGSNIPLMLIFFGMDMNNAIPVSNVCAVCSTVFRFILNFNVKHPNCPERACINYEIILLVMPAIFFGSMIGSILFDLISDVAKASLFGVTVAWSIYTTIGKARQILAEEKAAQDKDKTEQFLDKEGGDYENGDCLKEGGVEASEISNEGPLKYIRYEESSHFTPYKVCFIGFCFLALFVTQSLFGSKGNKSDLPNWARYLSLGVFFVAMFIMTIIIVKRVRKMQEDKEAYGYKYDAQDQRFDSTFEVAKLSFFCFLVAILCNCTGIAGGMVLGPLFLKYNMLPQVMSNTNQYITMMAALSVVFKFIIQGKILWTYSAIFGGTTLVCAYIGINGVNAYIKKTGKQSLITILLAGCLIIALVSLPLKYLLLHQIDNEVLASEK